ncbi:MAG: ABC transporter substrate-binding protein [Flavobacteriales bacterium]
MMKQKKTIWFLSVLALTGLIFYISSQNNLKAKGGKQYGGTLKISFKSAKLRLFPLADNTLEHHRAQQLIFEPLVKPNNTSKGWKYVLAKTIVTAPNQRVLTIHLRKNIHFVDDPCFRFHSSELTAEDVAFTLSLACSKQKLVQQDLILPELILGGKNYYAADADPLEKKPKGLRIIDDQTIEITLSGTYNHFLNVLSGPSLGILSKQAYKYYGNTIVDHPVGTGPYYLKGKEKAILLFARNAKYWRYDKYGNQLPYIDQIHVQTGVSSQVAHREFLNKNLDLLFDLPIDDLRDAFGSLTDAKQGKNLLHEVYIKNASKIHFIQFNSCAKPFNNPAIRRAFALVIDQNYICNEVLLGEGRALNRQFIPNQTLAENTLLSADQRSLTTKINEAKSLLLKAGYKPGSFPRVTFYVSSNKNALNYKWASAVAVMLKTHLNVEVKLKEMGSPKKQEAAMWRTGWVGDYPGAESYLRLFYSRAQKPVFFINKRVDSLYLSSVHARTIAQRNQAQRLCEKAIIEQQALIPIYTEDFIVLHPLKVRGFELDNSGLLDYAKLYIKELKQ